MNEAVRDFLKVSNDQQSFFCDYFVQCENYNGVIMTSERLRSRVMEYNNQLSEVPFLIAVY